MSYAFFVLKKEMLKPLLAQLLAFFATTLLKKPEKDTPHRVECTAKPPDAWERFNVFHREENISTGTSWCNRSLQECRLGSILDGDGQNGNFCRLSRIADQVHQNSVPGMSLRSTPDRQRVALRIVEDT